LLFFLLIKFFKAREFKLLIARDKPEDFYLISGDDMLTLPLLAIGATGVISVLANAFPHLFRQMVQSALEGNYITARKSAFQMHTMNALMYVESNPVGIKEALHRLGICENHVRLPLLPASDDLKKKIKVEMAKTLQLKV